MHKDRPHAQLVILVIRPSPVNFLQACLSWFLAIVHFGRPISSHCNITLMRIEPILREAAFHTRHNLAKQDNNESTRSLHRSLSGPFPQFEMCVHYVEHGRPIKVVPGKIRESAGFGASAERERLSVP